ncbi:membrane protein [Capnocytophaga sp. HP1101]
MRLTNIDLLRGVVMLLMCIDHARDYTHYHPADPMLLPDTPNDVFVLRILAHWCAPTFVLLAGIAVAIVDNRLSKKDLAKYLLTRGAILMLLEVTLVNWGWSFNPLYKVTYLQVIWAIGVAMIALSALVFLSRKCIALISIAILILHPLVNALQWNNDFMHYLWSFLLQKNMLLVGFGHYVRTTYPVLPIIAIMALGYVIGAWYSQPTPKRKIKLFTLGVVMFSTGIALRFIGYGDASILDYNSSVPLLMQVFNVTKYPISLPFALLFVGLSLIVLALTDGKQFSLKNLLIILGQTPMFFYILHLYLLHCGVVLYILYQGETLDFTTYLGGVPPTFGITMMQMYGLVLLVILLSLPLCKWYRRLKSSKRFSILRYL